MLAIERLDDGIAVLRLAHGKVNALDVELLEAIVVAFGEVADAPAVVLTGAGSSFSAGVDLPRILTSSATEIEYFLDALSRALLTVFTHPRPVLAAVNGHAIAGGCVLAVSADVRLMSGGSMGLTELDVGVAFPTAALEIARHAAGSRVQSLILSGRLIDPAEAVEVGFIDWVVDPDELLDAAITEARSLGNIPAETYETTKRQLHAPAMAAIAREYEIYDARVSQTWTSDSGRVAISSFVASLNRPRI
jgi:enoyl-CoA hydratase